MHGRLKIRTSEEEKERKKKEQLLKVRAYKHAMGVIQAKRKKEEFDDEMLQTISVILLRNPDISTLWNIRRECLLLMRQSLDECATKEANQTEDETAEKEKEVKQEEIEKIENEVKQEMVIKKVDPVKRMYDAELNLTEQCLVVNPKSYCAWHHRCWTLERSPVPNWEREVQLCNKYLKMDERNFHTWDYRRYVVEKAGVAKEQELDFCTEKIKVNFSNYSSWHHRSLLLPHLYPYEGDESLPKRPMNEAKLQEELEMVLTAAFTDPNDSSAWFYQRWLLSSSRAELSACVFRCNEQKAIVAFTKPIAANEFNVILTAKTPDESSFPLKITDWRAVNADSSAKVHTTWVATWPPFCTFDGDVHCIQIDIPQVGTQKLLLKPTEHDNDFYYFNAPNPALAFMESVLVELRSQLNSCNSLLEYEPDSKWTLLTTALLMHAIDRKEYHGKMMEFLGKLEEVDALRKGYYRDLASKWIVEKALSEWSLSDSIPKQLNLTEHTQLSSLYYPQYFSIADEVLLPTSMQESNDIDTKLQTFTQLES